MKGDRERCLAAGMDGYVSKPIRDRELFETIEQLGLESRMHAALPRELAVVVVRRVQRLRRVLDVVRCRA